MTNVVYLFGAGATHGCVEAVGSPHGILMGHLGPFLVEEVGRIVRTGEFAALAPLVNTIVDESTDFEHIISFLDSSSSALHRRLAAELRRIFHKVLKERLHQIQDDHGSVPVGLYEAVIDMHQVPGCGEALRGALTINYDEYFEIAALSITGRAVDYGIRVNKHAVEPDALPLIKLHGSIGWQPTWPIELGTQEALWIPPGIQKVKDRYPFSVLWGLARELLDCDVLRIVGCKLGPNDWDLIALLFSTQHDRTGGRPYQIEVIDAPAHVRALQASYPYLNIVSILELSDIGESLVSDFGGIPPQPFGELDEARQKHIIEAAGTNKNWFRIWLKQKAEALHIALRAIDTPSGAFKKVLEAY